MFCVRGHGGGEVSFSMKQPLSPKMSPAVSFLLKLGKQVAAGSRVWGQCPSIHPYALSSFSLCWDGTLLLILECLEAQPSFSISPAHPQSICYQGNSNVISLGVVRERSPVQAERVRGWNLGVMSTVSNDLVLKRGCWHRLGWGPHSE